MSPSRHFPRLNVGNHRETSPATPVYNCIAWAAEDAANWWQPGVYWRPADWPRTECGIGALERLFHDLDYEDCGTDEFVEAGYTKVALYATSTLLYTHAARQLPSGKWTSKLGKGIDIEHDTPDAVAGGLYGEVVQIMKRRTP